ncbi:MAG: hypothetical protein V1781_04400 [Bacteroidota bacterium]
MTNKIIRHKKITDDKEPFIYDLYDYLELIYGCQVLLVNFPFLCKGCGEVVVGQTNTLSGKYCPDCEIKMSKKRFKEVTQKRPIDYNEAIDLLNESKTSKPFRYIKGQINFIVIKGRIMFFPTNRELKKYLREMKIEFLKRTGFKKKCK